MKSTRNRLASIFAFLLAILLFSCNRNTIFNPVKKQIELNPTEQQVLTANNRFGFNLLKQLPEVNSNSNVVISPMSISMALSDT